MGKRAIGHAGLEKYIGYYVDEASSLVGGVMPELPWDDDAGGQHHSLVAEIQDMLKLSPVL
jgi:hypothetical protein